MNDPDPGITWLVADSEIILSDQDRMQLRLRDLPHYF